jgi:hypothetical protein
MSVINALALNHLVVWLHTHCERLHNVLECVIQNSREPVVSSQWTVEIDKDGTRRLVEHWSKNVNGSLTDTADGSGYEPDPICPEPGGGPHDYSRADSAVVVTLASSGAARSHTT